MPASTAVLGKDIAVDPKSGDVGVRDISVLQMKTNQEAFLKAWPVS